MSNEIYKPNEMKVREYSEKVPCGDAITTQYFEDEKLIRQDVKIIVDSKYLDLHGKIGE
jgi:hypothetical protein